MKVPWNGPEMSGHPEVDSSSNSGRKGFRAISADGLLSQSGWSCIKMNGLKMLKSMAEDYESGRNGSVKVDGLKARDKSFVWKDSGGKNIETLHEKNF